MEERLHQLEWESEVWQNAYWFAYYDLRELIEQSDMDHSDYINEATIVTEMEWTSQEKLDKELESMGYDKNRLKMMIDIGIIGLDKDFG
jgi:hypothetical protein